MALVPVQDLYDAFFVLLESDEWEAWGDEDIDQDLSHLARAAIPWFKFPRCSFDLDESKKYFIDKNVGNAELQILALFMKDIWYGRVIDSWENLRPLYTERDFSPAAQLNQFNERQKLTQKRAKDLEATYYRSIKGKPFDYSKLAGK